MEIISCITLLKKSRPDGKIEFSYLSLLDTFSLVNLEESIPKVVPQGVKTRIMGLISMVIIFCFAQWRS